MLRSQERSAEENKLNEGFVQRKDVVFKSLLRKVKHYFKNDFKKKSNLYQRNSRSRRLSSTDMHTQNSEVSNDEMKVDRNPKTNKGSKGTKNFRINYEAALRDYLTNVVGVEATTTFMFLFGSMVIPEEVKKLIKRPEASKIGSKSKYVQDKKIKQVEAIYKTFYQFSMKRYADLVRRKEI